MSVRRLSLLSLCVVVTGEKSFLSNPGCYGGSVPQGLAKKQGDARRNTPPACGWVGRPPPPVGRPGSGAATNPSPFDSPPHSLMSINSQNLETIEQSSLALSTSCNTLCLLFTHVVVLALDGGIRRNRGRRAMMRQTRFQMDFGTETMIPTPPNLSNTTENNGSSTDAP